MSWFRCGKTHTFQPVRERRAPQMASMRLGARFRLGKTHIFEEIVPKCPFFPLGVRLPFLRKNCDPFDKKRNTQRIGSKNPRENEAPNRILEFFHWVLPRASSLYFFIKGKPGRSTQWPKSGLFGEILGRNGASGKFVQSRVSFP